MKLVPFHHELAAPLLLLHANWMVPVQPLPPDVLAVSVDATLVAMVSLVLLPSASAVNVGKVIISTVMELLASELVLLVPSTYTV